jgi:23S rRNA-/tRNA-specific pseudouridylate synthase
MNITEKINRQLAREHLNEVLAETLAPEFRSAAVDALLAASKVKVQQRANKLTLTFDVVDEDDADSNDQEDNA